MQALTLYQNHNQLQDQIQDIQANLAEIREQATHRFASEMEKLQDQNDVLFTTWSEGLKEELKRGQQRIHERTQGDHMAFEIRLDRSETLLSHLALKLEDLEQLKQEFIGQQKITAISAKVCNCHFHHASIGPTESAIKFLCTQSSF